MLEKHIESFQKTLDFTFQIEEAIRALVYLFSHCTQATASKDEFKQLLLSLGFSQDAAQVLTETFTENEAELKAYLKRMGVQVSISVYYINGIYCLLMAYLCSACLNKL